MALDRGRLRNDDNISVANPNSLDVVTFVFNFEYRVPKENTRGSWCLYAASQILMYVLYDLRNILSKHTIRNVHQLYTYRYTYTLKVF